jgi:hypothetical protein
MKFNKQLFRHNPDDGEIGDCHRTAIACVLDLEPQEVPHFYADMDLTPTQQQDAFEDWLKERGFYSIHTLFQGRLSDVLYTIAAANYRTPGMLYLLGGKSRNGTGHSVVCQGEKIIHDPSRDNSGIVGPMDDGFYWVTFFGSVKATSPVVSNDN